jgi:hypothetical protein
MKWLFGNRDNINITAPVSQMNRYHELFDDGVEDHIIQMSDHFGYNTTATTFANASLKVGQQAYVVIPTLDVLLYQEVPGYTYVGRYLQQDFDRFTIDPTVEKVYDGVNIDIFRSARSGA